MKEFIVNVSSVENADDQTEFDLVDFQNKNQFMKAAIEAVCASTGETKPELRFEYDDASIFEGTSLVSEKNIDEKVWEYLNLTGDVALMTASFSMLYPDEAGNISELREIAEERAVGEYDKITDFGYAYLDANGFMDNLPPIIENNLDIDAISEGLMMNHKTLNNWYFANKDQDGWRLKGA
jgi:hypothetical protein